MFRNLLIVAAIAIPSAALADKSDADACATKFSGPTRIAYRGALPLVLRGATLEQALKTVLGPRVDRGTISEQDGRRIGREAANCLRLVHRKN